MKITNDFEYEAYLKVLCPWIDIDYMSPEAKEIYFNLTKEQKEKIIKILKK